MSHCISPEYVLHLRPDTGSPGRINVTGTSVERQGVVIVPRAAAHRLVDVSKNRFRSPEPSMTIDIVLAG
jgi:hypothetical protein